MPEKSSTFIVSINLPLFCFFMKKNKEICARLEYNAYIC